MKEKGDEVDARQQRTLGEALCASGERIESREGSTDDVVDDAYRRHPKQESGRSTISLLTGSKRSLKNNTKFARVPSKRIRLSSELQFYLFITRQYRIRELNFDQLRRCERDIFI